MRRIDLIRAVESINNALKTSEVMPALQTVFTGQDKGKAPVLLRALNSYSLMASRFDSVAREILKIFDLEGLENPEGWAVYLETEGRNVAVNYYQNINFVLRFLPRFFELLHQKGAIEYIESVPEASRGSLSVETVSVILLESERQFSTPQRLIEVLQAFSELYEGVALLHNQSADSLTVLSCDSGSDKSFDFLGLASLMRGSGDNTFCLGSGGLLERKEAPRANRGYYKRPSYFGKG